MLDPEVEARFKRIEDASLRQDGPKSLGDRRECQARVARLDDPHIRPLTALVQTIRSETGFGNGVPYFDPADGGVGARCLFLLEAPGRKAVLSGFVSRNNPDETAKNFLELNQAAGIPREQTVTWNVVPWYIGSGTKIRPAGRADVAAASGYLARLLTLLTGLKIVVFVGQKACMAEHDILRLLPAIKLITMPHPSPLFINRRRGNRVRILNVLQDVARLLANP
ncbi:MAG: uracil-DNA glycosylase [Acidobacteria bacterium]|nr:uracil-DNA glycosylase [Acidobacteriota bacterium]